MPRKSPRVESYAVRPVDQALPETLRKRAGPSLGLPEVRQRAGARRMRVGFIGLDPISQAMASKLLQAGHQLMLYDSTRQIPHDLQSAGGRVARTIQDACRWSDAVFTMLSSEEATEAVILSSGGVLENLPRKAVHIGSGTVSVECADRIVEAHWDAGKEYVSAPVLARSNSTAEVQLHVIAGGSDATFCQIESLLSPLGQLTQLSGWPSDANLVQLGADYSGATPFQFLARHPELCAGRDWSQLASPGFLDIATKGVLE